LVRRSFGRLVAAAVVVGAASVASAQIASGSAQFRGFMTIEQSAASRAPISQISVGGTTAALKTDGTVVCWGFESPIFPTNSVAQISAGYSEVMVLMNDGTVQCWGTFGNQLNVPAGLSSVVQVAAGQFHSVALTSAGKVVCWGDDTWGQCDVPAGALSGVVQVAAGANHTIALKSDGTILCWGANGSGQCTPPALPKKVIQVAGGSSHTAVLFADGTVTNWGTFVALPPKGLTGVISIGAGGGYTEALKANGTVVGWGANYAHQIEVPANLHSVVQLAVGPSGSAALKSDGTIVTWGTNMGNNNYPAPPSLNGVVQFAFGGAPAAESPTGQVYFHTAALLANGSVTCWGYNAFHECEVTEGVFTGLTGITQVATGGFHTVALNSAGKVTAWGLDDMGQTNVPAAALSGVVEIAAGGRHTLAVKSDHTVVAWGDNTLGQTAVTTTGIAHVAAGFNHSVLLTTSGTVQCFGANNMGQSTVPAGLTNVVQVAAGDDFSLARKADGTVVEWGNSALAVPVGLANVVDIQAGTAHAVALRGDGSLASWGGDGYGETPGQIAGTVKISAGPFESVMLTSVGLDISPAFVLSAHNATGTLTLPVAPTGAGADISLSSNDPSLTLPATVHVAAGVRTATFTAKSTVTSPKSYLVTATYGGSSSTASVVVTVPATLNSVTLHPASVVGGASVPVLGQVTLNAVAATNTNVTLTSSDPSVTVPATVTVHAGFTGASFYVGTTQVSTQKTVTISGSLGGTTKTGTLTNVPLAISSVTLTHPSVTGGTALSAMITLNATLAAPATITLASSDTSRATVPVSRTVSTGTNAATAAIATLPTATDGTLNISVSLNGATVSAPLTVLAPVIKTLTTATSLFGRQTNTGTVALGSPAPAGGLTIALSSDNAALSVPASVTVAAGATSATFVATAADPTVAAVANVTATLNGATKVRAITINPNKLTSFAVSETTFQGSSADVVTGTVTLKAIVNFDTVVTLTSSDPSVTVPSTVTILAGQKDATFTLGHSAVTHIVHVTVQATRNGTTLSQHLTVNP